MTEMTENTVPRMKTRYREEILPALRETGVTEDQIEELTVANPGRFFAGAY